MDSRTNFNKTYGTFAENGNEAFMVLNRIFEPKNGDFTSTEIDNTSYIDPSKYNYILRKLLQKAKTFGYKSGSESNQEELCQQNKYQTYKHEKNKKYTKLHGVSRIIRRRIHRKKVSKLLENNEPITDGAPIIFTEKKDGVLPQYDIRTDKWDIAQSAMDLANASKLQKVKE